ncbi:hypothetical protein HYU14_05205 [Candidatus Woesearchaeota archaeon]|nr:hypothetical protein [Candidatus Woesearchaeota archaeon]
MKKDHEDIPHKFWREYESMDMLDRGEKVKTIVEIIDRLHALKDKKLRQHALATSLQGYFDDIMDYMAVSMERTKNNKLRGK